MPLKSILFVTVHKGASTFIADELGRYLAASPHFNDFRPVGSLKIKGTQLSDMGGWAAEGLVGIRVYPAEFRDLLVDGEGFQEFAQNASLVFVQRDPRDVAVSLFYSKAYSHTTNVINKDRFVQDRERMQEMSLREGVWEFTARQSIAEFTKLHKLHDQFGGLLVRYEDLVTEPSKWFQSVGDHAEWPDELTESVISRFSNSFTPPEAQDPLQHKRRITPGNWQEVFDRRLERLYERRIGELMQANGYT